MAAKRKLGEILVASGAVTVADVQEALSDQSMGEPARLGDLLVSMGKLSTQDLARALAQQHGVPFTELPPIPSAILDLVPLDFQRQFRFVPLKVGKGAISIAMADLSHASTDVLPLLRRRFPTVQIFVAPGDAIDAVHAAVTGQYESPLNVALPSVAPAIAPVVGKAAAPKGEDLFESIDLFSDEPPDETVSSSTPSSPLFFEATASGMLTTPSSGLTATGSSPSVSFEVEAPPPGDGTEDRPFFAAAPRARPIAKLDDQAFVPGVPMSSPSSLAELVIEPELPALPIIPPPDLKVTVATQGSAPTRAAPAAQGGAGVLASAPSRQTLPEWLQTETPPGTSEGWSGALDALAPSKLILAVTKALLRRGLLTEQEILDATDGKKK